MAYFRTSDDADIYYQVNGEGLAIIFIHGFSESGHVFKIQRRALSKKYKLITYDIRGHGESDRAKHGLTMERLALDLRELIIYLKLDRVTVVAWSMGVSVLFEYIRNFGPERLYKICIVDKGPKMINDENWNLGLYHGKYNAEDFKDDLNMIRYDFPAFCRKFINTMSIDLSEREFKIGLEKMSKNSKQVLYCLWKSMGESDYRDVMKDIDIDTLIVFGEDSVLYSVETAEYLRDKIDKSKLEIFSNCGHLLILEKPRKFNKLIENFIEE